MEQFLVNSLPNNKILDWTKLKAFAEHKLNVARILIYYYDRVEDTRGNGKNAGYQYFLYFPQCSPGLSTVGSLKVPIMW